MNLYHYFYTFPTFRTNHHPGRPADNSSRTHYVTIDEAR